MSDFHTFGKKIAASDFERIVSQHDTARSQATKLIEDARRTAQQMISDAESQVAEHNRELENLSAEKLRLFIDEDTIRRHAQVFISVLSEVSRMRREHKELLPWIEQLVSVTLRKILARFDEPELIAQMVGAALQEMHQSQMVQMHVHPSRVVAANAARDNYPDLMGAVDQINADPQIDPDEYQLNCEIGSATISIEALEQEIFKVLEDQDEAYLQMMADE